jgi:hypothetical protein
MGFTGDKLGAVDELTGGEAVASMSVRSKSAMATGTCTFTSTCASGQFSFKLCSCCKVNDASGSTIFACSGCFGDKFSWTGSAILVDNSTILPCVKGTGAAADMHESPTMPIMLFMDGHMAYGCQH